MFFSPCSNTALEGAPHSAEHGWMLGRCATEKDVQIASRLQLMEAPASFLSGGSSGACLKYPPINLAMSVINMP